jgi:serine/threonine protein kinase
MGKYILGEVIGFGSFEIVYKAVAKIEGNVVLIKMINLAKFHSRMVDQEVQALRKLNHPNIVQYYESFQYLNNYCIVMELCEGKTLRQFISEQIKPLNE